MLVIVELVLLCSTTLSALFAVVLVKPAYLLVVHHALHAILVLFLIRQGRHVLQLVLMDFTLTVQVEMVYVWDVCLLVNIVVQLHTVQAVLIQVYFW